MTSLNTYRYKAVSRDGIKTEGFISAYSEAEAVVKLRETCSILTKIEEVQEKEKTKKPVKIKEKDLAVFCSQISIILAAGLPVVSCLRMLAEQQKNKDMQKILTQVAEDVNGGYSLADSFEKNNPNFPKTFIETVRAGEISGTLDACFARLEKYYDKASKTKSKLAGALIYPAIVIFVAIVVVIIIMVVAVPVFTETFIELGTELPGITKALIAVSDFFVKFWWLIVLLMGGGIVAFLLARKSEKGRDVLDNFSLTKSPLKKLNLMNASFNFAATLSTMCASGLPVNQALGITAAACSNSVFSKAVDRVRVRVEHGANIGDAMRQEPLFPSLLTEMTSVGGDTGSLESTLDVVSSFYSNEAEVLTARLLSMMEPMITVGLAVVTVVLLLAVYAPLFSMYGSI